MFDVWQRRLILSGLVLLASWAQAQEEHWLHYRSSRDAEDILGVLDSKRQYWTDRPERVAMPPFKSENPVFVSWSTPMAPSGQVWIALDRSCQERPQDLLYIDSDCDGDLSDEQGQAPYRFNEDSVHFGPIKVVFPSDDGPIAYHLNAFIYPNSDRFYLFSAGWYEGSVTLAGQTYHITLADKNCNGTFNDRSLDFSQADRISLTPQKKTDFVMPGRLIEIDHSFYALDIIRDGAFITLNKTDAVTLGQVRVPSSVTEFKVAGEPGQFTRIPHDGMAQLPIGSYRIDRWVTVKQDEQGRKWKMVGDDFGDQGLIEVKPDGIASLAIGEPAISSVSVDENNGTYSFDYNITGQLGESIAMTVDGSNVPAPKLHARDKTGQYDKTLNFGYG